jgi:methyl-accepting chemotaxis protein
LVDSGPLKINQKIIGAFSVAIDITSRKEEQEKLTAINTEAQDMATWLDSYTEEIRAIVTQIKQNVSTINSLADNNASQIELTLSDISESVGISDNLDTSLQTLISDLNNIVKASSRFDDIADQTNILSLNTMIGIQCIPGEYQKEIKVIADEIKTLSIEVKNNTTNIQYEIKKLNTSVKTSLNHFQVLQSKLKSIHRRLNDDITADELKTIASEISIAMEESQTAASDLSKMSNTLYSLFK